MQTHITSNPGSRLSARLIPAGALVPFILVTSLFFLWAMPNNLNDVLIRQFMKSFEVSRFQAGLVQSAFYFGYFLLASPAALLMRRYGYKSGILAGLGLMGCGCFLFWPAALIGQYSFFLGALFVIASGLSFLETAANPNLLFVEVTKLSVYPPRLTVPLTDSWLLLREEIELLPVLFTSVRVPSGEGCM